MEIAPSRLTGSESIEIFHYPPNTTLDIEPNHSFRFTSHKLFEEIMLEKDIGHKCQCEAKEDTPRIN